MNLEFSEMWFWKGPARWHFITVPEESALSWERLPRS
jgi:hypothetical protein